MNGLDPNAPLPTTDSAPVGEIVTASEAPVIAAVDFSPEAESALVWACSYAESIDAPLEILHVIHDPADAPGRYKPDNDDPLEPIVEVAHRKLGAFLDRIGQQNPALPRLGKAKSLCVPGLPATTILQVAQARGAQHLVLGGPRRNGLARLLHGSTGHQLAGQAQIPLTVVKTEES